MPERGGATETSPRLSLWALPVMTSWKLAPTRPSATTDVTPTPTLKAPKSERLRPRKKERSAYRIYSNSAFISRSSSLTHHRFTNESAVLHVDRAVTACPDARVVGDQDERLPGVMLEVGAQFH